MVHLIGATPCTPLTITSCCEQCSKDMKKADNFKQVQFIIFLENAFTANTYSLRAIMHVGHSDWYMTAGKDK